MSANPWTRARHAAYAREWRRKNPERMQATLDFRQACCVTAEELGLEGRLNRPTVAALCAVSRQAVEQVEKRALGKLALALLPQVLAEHREHGAPLPGWALRLGRQYKKWVDERGTKVSNHPPMKRRPAQLQPAILT